MATDNLDKKDSRVAQSFDVVTGVDFAEYVSPLVNIRKVVIENLSTNANSIFFKTGSLDSNSVIEIKPGIEFVIAIVGSNDIGYIEGERIGYLKSVGGMVARIFMTR